MMTSLASDSPSTRAAAARALGQTGHSHAADSLRPLVSSDQPVVAVAALEGLRGLRAPGIGDVLRQALKHSDREVVKGALRLVTEARREDGEDALMEALGHHAWDVRALAADLIAEHGVVTLMAVLHRHRTRETDEVVRERMDRALAALGSGTEEVP